MQKYETVTLTRLERRSTWLVVWYEVETNMQHQSDECLQS
jgi:hypothetical protein